MDDHDIATYRLRPRSPTPSSPPVSPSSNVSSINLPLPRETTHGAEMSERRDISSTLLQKRLREKRQASLSVKKLRRNSGSTDRSRIPSSPTETSSNGRIGENKPAASGATFEMKGNMGARDMQEALAKLQNQNFDLKFEVDTRRQRQVVLEAKIEELEEKNATLQAELEKRESYVTQIQQNSEKILVELALQDQALEEAVTIICNREAEIKLLNEGKYRYYSESPPSSPPQIYCAQSETQAKRTSAMPQPKTLKQMPSFLSDRTRSTEALRSLYHRSSGPELPKLVEEAEKGYSEDGDSRHSPRLSILSESSFRSVYGDLSISPVKEGKKGRNAFAVAANEWERPIQPSKQSSPTSLLPRNQREKFLSFDHVAGSPIRRMDGVKLRLEQTLMNTKGNSFYSKDDPEVSRKSSGSSANIQPYTNGYPQNRTLPPTPSTVSTNTLHRQQNSYDNSTKSSISGDDRNNGSNRSNALGRPQTQLLFDEASTTLRPSHQGSSNSRPRTAEEKGNNHFNTEQTELSEDNAATIDPWLASAQESGNQRTRIGVRPPRMFDIPSRDSCSPDVKAQPRIPESDVNAEKVFHYKTARRAEKLPGDRVYDALSDSNRSGYKQATNPNMNDGQTGSTPTRRRPGPPVAFNANKKPASSRPGTRNSPFTNLSIPASEAATNTIRGFGWSAKPSSSSKLGSRPPPSQSSTSNTPTSTRSTPSQAATDTSRKGSLTRRCRLPGLFGGRSETVPNLSSLSSEKGTPSPSTQTSQDTNKKQFQKRRNSSVSVASHPTIFRRDPPIKHGFADHPGTSATPPAIEDNRQLSARRQTSSSQASAVTSLATASRNRDVRPGTSSSLDPRLASSKLPTPISKSRDLSPIVPDYNLDGARGGGFGYDGMNSPRSSNDFSEHFFDTKDTNSEGTEQHDDGVSGDGINNESKIGKLKGAVWKTLGRR